MTASIPGENDTKRHRIALAALPFFLSACHLMPASKSGGVPSERAPVVWTVGHRASSSCMRAETRLVAGSFDRTLNFSFPHFSQGIETSSPRGAD